jgi:hypothetical protein
LRSAGDLGRRLVLAAFVARAVGAGAELPLLKHSEDAWQLVPLVVIPAELHGSSGTSH